MKEGSLFLAAVLAIFLAEFSSAETVADRKAAVLKDRATLKDDARWNYNDYERAFAEAKASGKPVLVVLRCIPCLACAGLDAQLLLDDAEMKPLLDQFVCARVINANSLDLSRFQFDFDLSFSAIMFNADGVVYGRYGSWAHQKDPKESATAGFREALEAALEIHRGYPANEASLAGKQPRPTEFKTPVDMPTLKSKYGRDLDWEGKVVQSCVHCHQIGDAQREIFRQAKKPIPPSLAHPFPEPETVGLSLALDHAARVKSVAPGSPAEKAGLRAGDDIVSFDGQKPLSIADVSWALHQAPETASITVEAKRDGKSVTMDLALPERWRDHSDISRRVGTWAMRAMALGGLLLEDLPDEERERRGLKKDQLALLAKHVGEYGEHAAAKKAGFRKDDVLVEVAGQTKRMSEGELISLLLRERQPGDKVEAAALRGSERKNFILPMQ